MAGLVVRWSNSSLRTLQECGEKFRRRYLEKEYVPPSPRMLRGTVVHRVAQGSYLRKLAAETLPTVEEAEDLAATEFTRQWKAGVLLSDEDAAIGIKAVEAQAKDFAVDLSGYHVKEVVPLVHPVAVERRIVVKPKDSDLEIHGVIDLIDQTPAGEAIRDLKTAEKSPAANAAETSQQLSFYALIRHAEVGQPPASLALDYLVRTPVKAEKKHLVQTTTRTREDIGALVNRINTAVDAVTRGVFIPANPDAWWCSKQWCEYFTTCPYVRRGPSRPAN